MQSGAIKDSEPKFPPSVQYFMFADQSCDGGESNIRECREIQYSLTTCSTTQVGWVVCQPGKGTSNMHSDTIAHLILSIIIIIHYYCYHSQLHQWNSEAGGWFHYQRGTSRRVYRGTLGNRLLQ